MTGKNKKSNWIYILGVLYAASAYTFVFLSVYIGEVLSFLPFVLGIINLIVMLTVGKRLDRKQLLNCTMLIKYSLIPFYIIGGGLILIFLLSSFIPVPFMIFLGPAVALSLCITGWGILIGAAPFSIAYIMKAYKEGVHGKDISMTAGIFQFFFVMDVVSVTVLLLKEKRQRKLST